MRKLFTPITIGPITIKNRFMMAPMENGLAAPGGYVNDTIIAFFKERAENDTGIILTGSVGVSPEGRGLPTQLSIYEDEFIPGLRQLTDALKFIMQAGRRPKPLPASSLSPQVLFPARLSGMTRVR